MKQCLIRSGSVLFMIALVTACVPAATETAIATQPPVPAATVTESTITEIPIVPITGPSMEVGSTYPYVDGSTLIAVPAGEFIMGADGTDHPAHTVNLSDFWIYSTKVTNRQYALCEELGQCTAPDLNDNSTYRDNARANDPVVGVTYDQAVSYCSFVGGRLPTEAEWEKAARGPDGGMYPWGAAAPSCDLLNFNNCVEGTTNVVSYPEGASYYGGLDLAGNVFEWVADWYDSNYYNTSPAENPQGPEGGTARSVRSSSYASIADQVAVTNRYVEFPENHRPDLGFRCVVEDPAFFAPFCESVPVYGSGTSGAPQSSCPALDVSQAQYCTGEAPMTNVTFSGPSDATIDYDSCIPSGNPNLFTCQSPGTIVSITADCQVDLPGSPSCPSGFSQKDNICVADGGDGQCLAGWDYDSSRGCCAPGSAGDSASLKRVCPVGTFYAENQGACLPYPVQEIVSVSVEVEFLPIASCITASGGGGGGGGSGNDNGVGPTLSVATPTAGSSCQPEVCMFGDWDPNECCCMTDLGCYP